MPSKTLFLTIFLMMISLKSFATTFQVIPLDQLVEESSSGAEVELKSKKIYKNNLGMIMTDFSFKVIEGFNLNDNDRNGELITITMSGGTLDGVTSYIDSAPSFDIGEKSFLLLKKIESRFYLSNFTMGKYKIEEIDGQIYYISSVFPYDKDLGRVKKDRMVDLMNSKFKVSKIFKKDILNLNKMAVKKLMPLRESRFEERAPAQVYDDKKQEFCLAMWSFFALFTISGLIIWWKLKNGVRA